MNWIKILIYGLITIFVFIPLLIGVIIPLVVISLGGKWKWFPSLPELIVRFNVDLKQEPYVTWQKRNFIIFVSLTAIELYTSFYLIELIERIKRLKKWIGKKF